MSGRIKLVGASLAIVLSSSEVAATSASAAALIRFSAEGAFSGGGGVALEFSSGKVVTCEGSKVEGEVTSETRAEATFLLEECTMKVSIITAKCTGEGESSGGVEGDIKVRAAVLLGSDKEPLEDKGAMLVQPVNSEGDSATVQ